MTQWHIPHKLRVSITAPISLKVTTIVVDLLVKSYLLVVLICIKIRLARELHTPDSKVNCHCLVTLCLDGI